MDGDHSKRRSGTGAAPRLRLGTPARPREREHRVRLDAVGNDAGLPVDLVEGSHAGDGGFALKAKEDPMAPQAARKSDGPRPSWSSWRSGVRRCGSRRGTPRSSCAGADRAGRSPGATSWSSSITAVTSRACTVPGRARTGRTRRTPVLGSRRTPDSPVRCLGGQSGGRCVDALWRGER